MFNPPLGNLNIALSVGNNLAGHVLSDVRLYDSTLKNKLSATGKYFSYFINVILRTFK